LLQPRYCLSNDRANLKTVEKRAFLTGFCPQATGAVNFFYSRFRKAFASKGFRALLKNITVALGPRPLNFLDFSEIPLEKYLLYFFLIIYYRIFLPHGQPRNDDHGRDTGTD
jgi:hypothetical protein